MARRLPTLTAVILTLLMPATFTGCGGSGDTWDAAPNRGGAAATAGTNGSGGHGTSGAANTAGSSSKAGSMNSTAGAAQSGGAQGAGGTGGRVTACQGSGQCAQPTPYCDTAISVCVECLGDANCGGGDRQHCALDTHSCVECTADTQCGGGAPYCSPTNACVECLGDGNCGANQACDLTRFVCVPSCKADMDCAAGTGLSYCDTANMTCVQCLGDGNCGNPDRPHCIAGSCAECTTDANCSGGNPYCQPGRNRCVECLVDANCPQGETCDADFSCQG